jgi:hypothetical protein
MSKGWYQTSKLWPKDIKMPLGQLVISSGIPRVTAASHSLDPNKPIVSMTGKEVTMSKSDQNEINNYLHSLGATRHDSVPIGQIFDNMRMHGVVPVQEDGTPWSGFLMGNKECGTEEARKQNCIIRLAVRQADGTWGLSRRTLSLSWCVTHYSPNAKYEVVAYVS